MAGRPVAFEVSSTSGFEAKNQKTSLWLLSGVIATATRFASSGMRLLVYLRGLIITSFDFIIGGLTAVSPVRLLSDLWQFTQTWTVGGTIASSTAVTGAVSRIAASVIRYLGGTIICTTGGLYYLIAWLLGGTVACSTTVIGGLSGIGSKLLAGAIDCATSIVNSGLRLYLGLRGSVSTASSLVGRFLLKMSLRGAVSATTSVLGRVTLAMIVSGVVRSATTVIGRVTGTSRRLISGVVTCGTAIMSRLVLVLHFRGVVASTTSILFNLFKGAQHQFLSGLIICGPNPYFVEEYFDDYFANFSAFSGNLKLGFRFGGTVTIVTRLVSEGIRLFLHLAGAIASGTVVIIGLTGIATWLVSGAIVCTTAVISGLTGITTWFLGGVITCATAVTGRLRLALHQAGTIRISTVVSLGSLRIIKFLQGIITSVTSIFGAPGGGVSYWGITGVTEPQHLWPFSITGDYSDQGSTGGLTLLKGGSGPDPSWDGSGYLILPASTYLYCGNDADLGSLGSTFSIIWEWVGINDYQGFVAVAEGAGSGDGWFVWGYQDTLRASTYNPHDTRNDDMQSGALSTTGGLNQAVWVQDGGNAVLYVNGEIAKTSTALAAPTDNTTNNFTINGIGISYSNEVHWLRVGVLKGTAWSADDVAAIYAGPVGEPIGVNITIRVLLSSIIACATSVVGRLKLRMLLSGIIASGTAVLGSITRIGVEVIEYLSGVIASGTSMLAAIRLYMKLSGVIQSTTAVLGRLIEYLHLGGIISSVTSIFGAPGGGVSYWGITGVTEPQHLWPFSITGDYSDQGSTGGLTLTAAGSGNSFGAGGLILNGSGWATGPNDADVMDLGSTYSIIWEASFSNTGGIVGASSLYLGLDNKGVNCWTVGSPSVIRTQHGWGTDTGLFDTTTTYSGTYQVVHVYSGGNVSIYVNGSFVTSGALTAPAAQTTVDFGIGALNYLGTFKLTGTIKRVGILKGTAWSADDVAAIYAGPTGPALGVNITIRKLLSSLIVVSTSIASAGVRLYMHLSGAVASVTRLTGALLRRVSLAGTAVCSTLVSAALRLYMHLSGIITSTTSVLANLTRIGRQFVSGVIICTTTVLGSVTRIGVAVIEYLSGVIASGTSVVSNLQRFATWLLGGVIATVTAVTASAFISRLLSGVIACATTVTGALSKVWTLSGVILSNTAVLGNLTQFFARYLSGTIAISTSIIGNVINIGRKLIGGVIMCGTYVYMGFLSGFSSAGALGRRFIDGVHKMYIKAKQRLKIEP